jgi:uncharacterized BrkB/YihY/UPF0761 family membrane protein
MPVMRGVFSVLSTLLTLMFVVGMAGCVVVIPLVAYRLFRALIEKDTEEENGKPTPHPT